MEFNSYHFMFFFPIVVIVYLLIPKKARQIWLLLTSYYFYMSWNPKYVLLIAFSTVVTYASGRIIQRYKESEQKQKAKRVLMLCISANLAILGVFKYLNFVIENLNRFLNRCNVDTYLLTVEVLLPVGISFYTFQALGYVIDVYRGDIEAENNLLTYALFVVFFPQLVAGPIERSKNLLPQIRNLANISPYNWSNWEKGTINIVWGLVLKMVLADRLAIYVNSVWDALQRVGTVELVLAVVFFAIQIYCDFYSYSIIAVGVAQIFGISLMDNFMTPYFSKSVGEYWRRWHISLSQWFRDYVYIPLGGSRCNKAKNYRNIMITMLLSGLWHGAGWTYVMWGGIHGAYQIAEKELKTISEKVDARFEINTNRFSYRFGKTCVTFILVCFAWIFFRAPDIQSAWIYITRMFTKWNPDRIFNVYNILYDMGMGGREFNLMLFSLFVFLLIELVCFWKNERFSELLIRQGCIFKWGVVIALICAIYLFGVYGTSYTAQQFIYFQF